MTQSSCAANCLRLLIIVAIPGQGQSNSFCSHPFNSLTFSTIFNLETSVGADFYIHIGMI